MATSSECLMDELAEKVGVDPLELRYRNVYRPGDTTPTGQTPDVYSLPEMIEKLRPLYKAALEKARQESTPEKCRSPVSLRRPPAREERMLAH